MKIVMVGLGPGDLNLLSKKAYSMIEKADLLIGSNRLLESLNFMTCKKIKATRADEIIKHIDENTFTLCMVVFSGDTGFYSGATSLIQKLDTHKYNVEIFPSISSVQLFASKLVRPWQDWNLCSMHGADCNVLAELKRNKPLFLLTSSAEDVKSVAHMLIENGLNDCTITVGERLSYADEKITVATPEQVIEKTFDNLNVMLIEKKYTKQKYFSSGIPDSEFIRGEVPMTKQEVRAILMSKLQVKPDMVCWDVGAGTGSVSVEFLLIAREVYAIEKEDDAIELIKKNKQAFSASNIQIIKGEAPSVLENLPAPDVVFVGGSTGKITAILDVVKSKNENACIAATSITIETVNAISTWMKENNFNYEIIQVCINRSRVIGGVTMLMANNPVFIIVGKGNEANND